MLLDVVCGVGMLGAFCPGFVSKSCVEVLAMRESCCRGRSTLFVSLIVYWAVFVFFYIEYPWKLVGRGRMGVSD